MLPIYDFGGVDELNPDKLYNWGYNPEQYNVPEGWYSSDPESPYKRINELKEMGFEVPLIKIALRKNNHKVQDAMIWLFSPEAMDFVPYPED